MDFLHSLQTWVNNLGLPHLIIIGLAIFGGLYAGKLSQKIKLPSIIGYMFVGALLGPSLFNLFSESLTETLSFITEIALGFVALSIGLELGLSELRKQGFAIVLIIVTESFLAFGVVVTALYFLTGNLPMALLFGAIAPASAPAGTVAIIQEYKAKGPLTKALYSVVGFDDGLGIIIFGFASAIAKSLLSQQMGETTAGFFKLMSGPFYEILLSIIIGTGISILFSFLARKLKNPRDVLNLIVAFIFIIIGISKLWHLSLILTNMIFGMTVVNTQPTSLVKKIGNQLTTLMPLLFILFFVLAGANLHVNALPSLGVLGLVYFFSRIVGLMGGSWLGAAIGGAEKKLRKYLGMGILSQAGVAIGLALNIKHEFTELGTTGEYLGATIITTITATCILFELLGPILTKKGLELAGEIDKE